MRVYFGTHPVFVSHTEEVEQLLYFLSDLQQRLQDSGKDRGEQYECLGRVRRKCTDLLLKLYTEDSPIMLMDDLDARWVQLITGFVRDRLQAGQQKAG